MNPVFAECIFHHQAKIIPQDSPVIRKPPAGRGFSLAASPRQDYSLSIDLDEGAVNGKPACEQSVDINREQRPPHLMDANRPVVKKIHLADDFTDRGVLEKNQVGIFP
jgi:hypothetical protein